MSEKKAEVMPIGCQSDLTGSTLQNSVQAHSPATLRERLKMSDLRDPVIENLCSGFSRGVMPPLPPSFGARTSHAWDLAQMQGPDIAVMQQRVMFCSPVMVRGMRKHVALSGGRLKV